MVNMLKPDGGRIKILRIRRGWQQSHLALITGVSLRAIERVEAGGNASFETLRSLARVFEVNVHELMKDSVQGALEGSCRESLTVSARAAATIHWILSRCLPFVPAAKGILGSFALILLIAFAIRISPWLIDLEPEIGTVEPTQFIANFPRVAPSTLAVGLQTEKRILPAASIPDKRGRLAEIVPMAHANPDRAESPAEASLPAMAPEGHSGSLAPVEPAPPKPKTHGLIGSIDIAWLASLVEPEPAAAAHAKAQSVEKNAPPQVTRTESPSVQASTSVEGQGASGYHPLVRVFRWSGKGTAIFFTKVGSSIKKAF